MEKSLPGTKLYKNQEKILRKKYRKIAHTHGGGLKDYKKKKEQPLKESFYKPENWGELESFLKEKLPTEEFDNLRVEQADFLKAAFPDGLSDWSISELEEFLSYSENEAYHDDDEFGDSMMDGDAESALASAGFGTDEDYGYFGEGKKVMVNENKDNYRAGMALKQAIERLKDAAKHAEASGKRGFAGRIRDIGLETEELFSYFLKEESSKLSLKEVYFGKTANKKIIKEDYFRSIETQMGRQSSPKDVAEAHDFIMRLLKLPEEQAQENLKSALPFVKFYYRVAKREFDKGLLDPDSLPTGEELYKQEKEKRAAKEKAREERFAKNLERLKNMSPEEKADAESRAMYGSPSPNMTGLGS